ncbi:uncharacterized protein DNG_04353 [Cephalotrichum gorgonifer]|uniref:Exportin-1/Importin-beta-like domain-containing protein n=1 Tax=Cephalotrichum gorgonifer TaxID=2041049 RepID=A0AAE8SUG6_9PEZI|nr:uncharacterized protein DNG_04353 [Cephalotrichum gorgonifer]
MARQLSEPQHHQEGNPLFGARFDTLDAAETALKDAARDDLFALNIESKHPNGAPTRVVFTCSNGRKPRNDPRTACTAPSKRRKTKTQMCGCPYRIAAKKRGTSWVIERVNSPSSLQHQGHYKPDDISTHPQYHREAAVQWRSELFASFQAGVTAPSALENLRSLYPDAPQLYASDSEEVIDYSADQMKSTNTSNFKTTMCTEFPQIFQLFQEILNTANQPSLIKAILETLRRFCNRIPQRYIFETMLIDALRTRFLEVVRELRENK